MQNSRAVMARTVDRRTVDREDGAEERQGMDTTVKFN